MRAMENCMEGKTLEHAMIPALILNLCNVIGNITLMCLLKKC
jgi:hypothetical protein